MISLIGLPAVISLVLFVLIMLPLLYAASVCCICIFCLCVSLFARFPIIQDFPQFSMRISDEIKEKIIHDPPPSANKPTRKSNSLLPPAGQLFIIKILIKDQAEIYLDDPFGSEQKGISYEFKHCIDQTGIQPMQHDMRLLFLLR